MTTNTTKKFDLNAYLLDSKNIKSDFRKFAKTAELIRGLLPMLDGGSPAVVELRRLLNSLPRQVKVIECANGLRMSVQASQTHYCTPRNSTGPWVEVEVGYPSSPVQELKEYAENDYELTNTVYAYVPVGLVEQIVEENGGLHE